MPSDQAIEINTFEAVGPPVTMQALTASAAALTGWLRAQPCSQPGILAGSTKALEAKTSGASRGNAAAWAASPLVTESPMRAKIQLNAKPNRTRMNTPS